MDLQEWCIQNNRQDLIEQWSSANDKNINEYSSGSHIKVKWMCPQGHEYLAAINCRVRGNNCPYCAGKQVLVGFNDLQTTNPKLAFEWNHEKNNNLKPTQVTAGSSMKVWWKCELGHEWDAIISNRNKGSGCPYCSNQKILVGFNDLATTHPELLSEWDFDKNDVLPSEVVAGTARKIWWKCSTCNYGWKTAVNNRVFGYGCPKCSAINSGEKIHDKALFKNGSLEANYPEIASEWDNDKNGDLKPSDVTPMSDTKVWWKCGLNHEWEASIDSRTNMKSGCPYCSGRKVLKGFNDLATKYPEIALEWDNDKNGDIRPDSITVGGNGKKYWWKCHICGYEWQMDVQHRVRGQGCIRCGISNRERERRIRLVETNGSLKDNYPDLMSEWDYDKNKDIDSGNITAGSDIKVWWKCKFGHEWKAVISSRVRGSGCRICDKERHTSFPEQALFFYIKKYFPDAVNSDRDTIGMELDIYIPSLRIAIEYDGMKWHKNNINDLRKNELCNVNNILLIRIREEGLDLYDDCHCIVRTNINSNSSLSDVIKRTLFDINNISDTDVDVDRDSSLIHESCISMHRMWSLAIAYPEIAMEWHPTKNKSITPDMVAPKSNKKFWWKCSKCDREWQATVTQRTARANVGCSKCNYAELARSRTKSVICIETGNTYSSLGDAAISADISKTSICNCCIGKQQTAGGFHWKYVDRQEV